MKDKEKIRALLIKARTYRLCSIIFAVMGIVIFAFLYYQNMSGNILNALHDPYFIVVIAFPFVPAAVLSWMAASAEKKMAALLQLESKDHTA